MRGIAIGVVAVVVGLIAAGCGGGGGSSSAERTSTAAKQITVGLVTDIGQLNDRGFNHLAFLGLKRAERELGVKGRVFQSATAAEYVPNMATLGQQGYDLVISVGYAQGPAVDTVAPRFPKTKFEIIDVDQTTLKHRPKNVLGLLFREEQVGYLTGYLAALVAKDDGGPQAISSVGGVKEPPVDRFIAGYQAGARRADPSIRLMNGYSQDWDDAAKCKEIALSQIARGAQIVFQVAGGCGLGALDAAKERRVWGIGVDADQSFLGPHILTSAEKKVDQAVFLTIEAVVKGTWQGGRNRVFGLAEGGVGLGKVSSKVSKEDLEEVGRIKSEIVSGKVQIPKTV